MASPWKIFYFDGNQAWGLIESPEEWQRIVGEYKAHSDTEPDFLRRARFNPRSVKESGIPAFGFYGEYTGPLTLGEWADQNGMSLKPA